MEDAAAVLATPLSKTGAFPIVGRIEEIRNDILDADSNEKFNSKMFKSLEMAVSACGSKQDVCGDRVVDFTLSSTPVDVDIDLTSSDSCHYLITTDCYLPEVEITASTLTADNFVLDFIEWEDNSVLNSFETGLEQYPDIDAEPKFLELYSSGDGMLPPLVDVEYLEEYPSEQYDTIYKNKIPIERITTKLEEYNAMIATYNEAVDDYLDLKDDYDEEVEDNTESYEANQALYNERDIFTCMFGCDDQEWNELTLEAPVRPERPGAFTGLYIDDLDLTVEEGLGAFVAGRLDYSAYAIAEMPFKAFGV